MPPTEILSTPVFAIDLTFLRLIFPEASGNINLKKVKSISKTGVDRISVGGITHSAPAIDFKLEI